MKNFTQSKKYIDFFRDCVADGVKNVLLQGSRRSRKTWSTIDWLFDLGALMGSVVILVATDTYPTLQLTMQDFEACTGVQIHGSDRLGLHCYTDNNVLWQFKHFDSATDAQGSQCDFLFVNEAVKMNEAAAATLRMGVRRQSYYNFNPTQKSWVQRLDNSRTLCTTFRDNPFITEEQLAEFENIRERAQRPNASRFDLYQYRVYYLGEFDQFVGRIFTDIGRISLEAYRNIPAMESYGIDFGFATDGDPTTLVGCKRWNGKIYFHEYIYEKGLTNDRELGLRLLECGMNYATVLNADYGGMGKGRIYTLRTADNGKWTGELAKGFSIQNAMKTKVDDGVSQLLAEDGIVLTEESAAMRAEMEEYARDENGKFKGADHALDAARYAYVYNKRMI